MLVFAISDKGGTGRSVTGSNIAYRYALLGHNACYVDFDFGSPTVGAIFNVSRVARGTEGGDGTHSYIQAKVAEPRSIDVWAQADRETLYGKPPGAGRLVLFPGDANGGEFPIPGPEAVRRCADFFLRLNEEFDLCMVDLSAGRSFAAELVLAATAQPKLRQVPFRWLVFHRWTRQHIIAANGLVYGEHGLGKIGASLGHDEGELLQRIRFVRTAVLEQDAPELSGLRPTQLAWLSDCDRELQELAARNKVGRTRLLGKVPLDPVLQWREQLISDEDVLTTQIANKETVAAFEELAKKIFDDDAWVGL